MSAGRRGLIGVANSRGDSRPGGGGVEEGVGRPVWSGIMSTVSGSVEGSGRVAG